MTKKLLIIGAAVLAVAASATAAEARSNIGVSISSGGYYGGPAYHPAPVYYQPAPVYYAPPPVVYQPYPYYSPAYRINYWNGPGWRGPRGHWNHGHGHGHHRGGPGRWH